MMSSPFVTPSASTNRMMLLVIVALLPGTLIYAAFFGPGVLVNIAFASVLAIAFEAAVLLMRKRPLKPYLGDWSALVTAWLFALSIPMHSPWWLIATGIGFAMLAGKHLYGGLGFNPFNPAMIGFVVVLIAFPKEMTVWFAPEVLADKTLGWSDSLAYLFGLSDATRWDALTSATPLDHYKTSLSMDMTISEIRQSPLYGDFGGVGWEWVANGWLIGGLFLLLTGTIRWHIPVAMIGSLLAIATLFWMIDPDSTASPAFHLFSGGVMLGAFFIATDPVTAATTPRGRLVYGALIGLLIYIIRSWGSFPDGVAFAVLLANMATPLIDYYTQPRVYGEVDDDD